MRARLALGVGVVAAAAAHACTDLPTGAETPFSIAFNSAPAPGVVVGDTLRDSTGAAARLSARVFNLDGDELSGSPAGFFLLGRPDSLPVTLTADGYIVAKSDTALVGRTFRVVAFATADEGLQSAPLTLTVTRAPTTLTATPGTDSIGLAADSIILATVAMVLENVVIESGVTRERPVSAYEVRFEIIQPAIAPGDTSFLALVDGGRVTSVDTTDGGGNVSRSLRVRVRNFPRGPSGTLDTLTVRVRGTARYRTSLVTATKSLLLRLGVR